MNKFREGLLNYQENSKLIRNKFGEIALGSAKIKNYQIYNLFYPAGLCKPRR
jgi:hypothetical protein